VTTILGVETSCDETSAAVLEARGDAVTLRSLVILSQDVHRVFGGVVPEIASRAHLTAIVPVVARALGDARITVEALDAVAVTHAPGLVGALLVGLSFGKAYAFARGIPVVGVHHMEGHLFATALEHPDAVPPFTALLVSGGHTMLLDVEAWGRYRLLGATRDDAAGEAFDKVAKLLGLPYPGGPSLERLARAGTPERHRFTRPMLRANQRPDDPEYYDVSFSGLKTAVARWVEKHEGTVPVADVCASFQEAVVDVLTAKAVRAACERGMDVLLLGGGVAANSRLRALAEERCTAAGLTLRVPRPGLCTDNGAMVAALGAHLVAAGAKPSPLDLPADSSLPVTQVLVG